VVCVAVAQDFDQVGQKLVDDVAIVAQRRHHGDEAIGGGHAGFSSPLPDFDRDASNSIMSKTLSIFPPTIVVRATPSCSMYRIGRLSSPSLRGRTVRTSQSDSTYSARWRAGM